MIGDTDADVGAARAAGLAGIAVVDHPRSAHRRSALADSADTHATGVLQAVKIVLARLAVEPVVSPRSGPV